MVKKIKIKKRESLIISTLKLIDFIFKRGFDETELDLETISTKLNIKKRRLYDLTNVLEGIGYLKKHTRNVMIITAKFYHQILILKTNQIIKSKIKSMEEKSKKKEMKIE